MKLRGFVRVKPDTDFSQLVSHLEKRLRAKWAFPVLIDDSTIEIQNNEFMFAFVVNKLIPMGRFTLRVCPDQCRVNYELKFSLLIYASLALIVFVWACSIWKDMSLPWAFYLAYFVWLVGGNLVGGVLLFHFHLRHALGPAPKTAAAH